MNWRKKARSLQKIFWAVFATALIFKVAMLGTPAVSAAVSQEKEAARVWQERLARLEALQDSQEEETKEEQTPESVEAQRQSAMTTQLLLEEKKNALEGASSEEKETLRKELEDLEKELLKFPKRDRFRFGGDFDMTYDNNKDRNVIRSEEGDTLLNLRPFASYDLSGKKTTLNVEYTWNHPYNVKVNEGRDSMTQEIRVRSGRKIGKKTTLSLNDRLTREGIRDAEIDDDGKKVTWTNSHHASVSHQLNRKFTANFDVDYSRTDFPHENFDQDGSYQVQFDPNFFLQLTPKTRFSSGYRMSVSRPKTEGSDKTDHQFRVGVSTRITAKSTLQADLSQIFTDPDTAQTGRSDQTTSSLGYAWQATPKTSLRVLYSNSFTHTISDSISGLELLKTTLRSSSDTLGLSIRFRLNRKISAEFSSNIAHSHSKTRKTGVDNVRSRTWTFPFQAAADFSLAKWIRLRFAYTYRHQIGNEEADEHRAHTWFFGTNASL